MKRTLALGAATAAAAALVALAAPATAHPPSASHWKWQPAYCKSYLAKGGVLLNDGRRFRAISNKDVFCGGLKYCAYQRSTGVYFYDHFVVALIDGNRVFRTMTMHITGQKTFRVSDIERYGQAATVGEVQEFRRVAKKLMASVARKTQPSCEIV